MTRNLLAGMALGLSMLFGAAERASAIEVTPLVGTPAAVAAALEAALFPNGAASYGITNLSIGVVHHMPVDPATSTQLSSVGAYLNASGTYDISRGIVLSSGHVGDHGDGPDTANGWGSNLLTGARGDQFAKGETGVMPTAAQDAMMREVTGLAPPIGFDPALIIHHDVTEILLSFDALPGVTQLAFKGAIGTDEFPEFVPPVFDPPNPPQPGDGFLPYIDGFGIFVNGTTDAENIAKVGGAATNAAHTSMTADGSVAGTQLDSLIGSGGGAAGVEHMFTASIDPTSNEIRIIIGDGTDASVDTTAFLSAVAIPVPELTVDPLALVDFGKVLVGTTGTEAVTATNTGEPGSFLEGEFGAPGAGPFARSGAAGFGPLAKDASEPRDYEYSPAARSGGEGDGIAVTSNGGDANLDLSGQGVAPVADVSTGNTDAGVVRIGTSGSASIGLQNIGDGNENEQGIGAASNLNEGAADATTGEFHRTSPALSLADGASDDADYDYTPTDHGVDIEIVSLNLVNGNPDGTNTATSPGVELSGQGVGPEFDSNHGPGGDILFGGVDLGEMLAIELDIFNASPDGDLGNLTDLSIFDAILGGPGMAAFEVIGFAPTALSTDEHHAPVLMIKFTPTDAIAYAATLTFETDQDAAFGVNTSGPTGDFVFNLTGSGSRVVIPPTGNGAVPEPLTAFLGLMGLVALDRSVARRRAA